MGLFVNQNLGLLIWIFWSTNFHLVFLSSIIKLRQFFFRFASGLFPCMYFIYLFIIIIIGNKWVATARRMNCPPTVLKRTKQNIETLFSGPFEHGQLNTLKVP